MITKTYSKTGKKCRVTFKLAADEAGATVVALVGDFNGWDPEANLLTARKDGSFSTTVSLDAEQDYRFRYLLDEKKWINDDGADELVDNRFGGEDCVVTL